MALSHALLSLLLHRPCSGYDLAKRFDSSVEGSVGFFWDASHQQIYRELTRLEEQGWLRSETIHQESRPNKRIYYVTDAGKAAFQAWVAQPMDMSPMKDDLLVKLFGGYAVPRDVILAELAHHHRQHQQRLAIYQNIEQQFFQSPAALSSAMTFSYLTLRFGISHEQMWLDWYQETLTFLTQPAG
jgi:DNA-binding PadR family transcriptional regulator